ncbi:unnamed protein product [Aspergillus oryzae var. brunneus]|uniref:Unnamed protein product n=2 Tax=Aspergillus oryzae TaxID=5062 RepID=A0AAN5BWZ7_ASPOZ|nr:unnamed protein product [Aspergillus oryzae]GMG42617.1 unnamed protein product [Aspergillus oryzae var. brunneus]
MRVPDSPDSRFDPRDMAAQDEKPHDHEVEEVENGIHVERSIRVALILASATLAGAFGGAIAYGVGYLNRSHGLSAWRWLFIIEGAPSCASAILVWFLLPDYPETAGWLNAAELNLAKHRLRLEGSKSSAKTMSWSDAKTVLTDWRLYGHYAVCVLCLLS